MPDLVETVGKILLEKDLPLVTAESCTGGMVAAAITGRPGASKIFERGFVTYSNESKNELLGVPFDLIDRYGAVSRETAEAMVRGALERSRGKIAVAVTGIAGPDGGTELKPVGLVYIGYALKGGPIHVAEHHFSGDRTINRQQTVEAAFRHLLEIAEQ